MHPRKICIYNEEAIWQQLKKKVLSLLDLRASCYTTKLSYGGFTRICGIPVASILWEQLELPLAKNVPERYLLIIHN